MFVPINSYHCIVSDLEYNGKDTIMKVYLYTRYKGTYISVYNVIYTCVCTRVEVNYIMKKYIYKFG